MSGFPGRQQENCHQATLIPQTPLNSGGSNKDTKTFAAAGFVGIEASWLRSTAARGCTRSDQVYIPMSSSGVLEKILLRLFLFVYFNYTASSWD